MPRPECPLCSLTNCFHRPQKHISNKFIDLYFNYTTNKKTSNYILEIYEDKIQLFNLQENLADKDKFKLVTSLENFLTEDKSYNMKTLNKIIENLLFI